MPEEDGARIIHMTSAASNIEDDVMIEPNVSLIAAGRPLAASARRSPRAS